MPSLQFSSYNATSPSTPTITSYSMEFNMEFALPYFFILIMFELFYEFLYYKKKCQKREGKAVKTKTEEQWNYSFSLYRLNDALGSLACGVTERIGAKLLFESISMITYCYAYHYARIWTLNNSMWVWWLAFFLKDHQYYWFHRFAHECNVGWASHAPHHSSEEYNLTTALRQGIFQAAFSWIFYIPMAIIGISPELYSLHDNLNLMYQFWIHTRAIERFPWFLEYIFNTPSHHRVHHGRNRQYIDKNYAGTLIIFDRMYGTFEGEKEEVVYGLTVPIESFSPSFTQFHKYQSIWKNFWKLETLQQKLELLFRAPGYDPVTRTFREVPEAPSATRVKKYHPKLNAAYKKYGSFHFFFTVFLVVLFLVDNDTNYFTLFTQGIYCYFTFSSIGFLFDTNFYAAYMCELLRLGGSLAVITYNLVLIDNEQAFSYLLLPKLIYSINIMGVSMAAIVALINALSAGYVLYTGFQQDLTVKEKEQ